MPPLFPRGHKVKIEQKFEVREYARRTARASQANTAKQIIWARFTELENQLEALGFTSPVLENALDEAEERLIQEVEDAIAPIVRVRFPGTSNSYCYRDPSGELEVGDLVVVPVGSYDQQKTAEVVDFGRGTWRKPVTKSVIARLERVDL